MKRKDILEYVDELRDLQSLVLNRRDDPAFGLIANSIKSIADRLYEDSGKKDSRNVSDEERQRRAENMRRLRAEGVISRRGCKDKGPRKTRSDKGVARKKEA